MISSHYVNIQIYLTLLEAIIVRSRNKAKGLILQLKLLVNLHGNMIQDSQPIYAQRIKKT